MAISVRIMNVGDLPANMVGNVENERAWIERQIEGYLPGILVEGKEDNRYAVLLGFAPSGDPLVFIPDDPPRQG